MMIESISAAFAAIAWVIGYRRLGFTPAAAVVGLTAIFVVWLAISFA
jgi:hypothetical protein